MNMSIYFFDTQFGKQIAAGDLALNPFEAMALPYLQGRILDFGCGLGNLALAAARQGHTVVAIDGSPTAIRHLAGTAAREGLAITALTADLRLYDIIESFDVIAAIGLLMFLDCATARHQLDQIRDHVRPGGIAAINVLIQGTNYLDMFDQAAYCLFERDQLRNEFSSWDILEERFETFPGPGDTIKSFVTLIARKPA